MCQPGSGPSLSFSRIEARKTEIDLEKERHRHIGVGGRLAPVRRDDARLRWPSAKPSAAARRTPSNQDPDSVVPLAQTVSDEMADDFLAALGLDPQLMEQI